MLSSSDSHLSNSMSKFSSIYFILIFFFFFDSVLEGTTLSSQVQIGTDFDFNLQSNKYGARNDEDDDKVEEVANDENNKKRKTCKSRMKRFFFLSLFWCIFS